VSLITNLGAGNYGPLERARKIASNVLRSMRRSTTDPTRREELDQALEGL
jgi:hypothetical protein